jgi:hypothetical protein
VNYRIGVNVVRNFKQQGIDIDLEMVVKGMQDAFSGGMILMSEDELRAIMTTFQNELRDKQALALKRSGEENKKKGEAFLAENAKKPGGDHSAEWLAIYGPCDIRWPKTHRGRQSRTSIPGYAHRWDGVRQLVQKWAVDGHPCLHGNVGGLARSPKVNAGRFSLASLSPA